MNLLAKVASGVSAIGVIAGATIAIESRYALAEELMLKADAAIVKDIQVVFMEDKLDELKFQQFEIKQKQEINRSDFEIYKLQRIETRIEKLQRKLDKLEAVQ